MSIHFDETAKTISLYTEHTTYQMKLGPGGLLLHTYYGPSAQGDMSYSICMRDRGFSGNPNDAGSDRRVSADTLPMEFPCDGSGDYRAAAFGLRAGDGTVGCDLRYRGHEILPGKYTLPGLPAVYSDEDAQTLRLTLRDEVLGVEAVLLYGVLPGSDVITRTVTVRNQGPAAVTVLNAASLCLDFTGDSWELIHFRGRHAGERELMKTPVDQREILIGSRRGTSSHHQNPFVILADRDTREGSGPCIGAGLLWSGSFACNVGGDPFGGGRLVLGIQPEHFDYPLEPGEAFQAPEAVLAYSQTGLAHLSHLFHDLVSEHIVRGPWKDRRRPVLINNWEATQMDFDGEKILAIARQAAALGVEMMVLDDGWFGGRKDDNAGLGDWWVNTGKLGGTMGGLAEKIRAMGMKFGLWIEPEMVNEDSGLYRAHPDWAFQIPGRGPVRGRNQLVLDFSRPEIVDAIFEQIAAVLDECQADYVKMDMNRSICDVYSAVMSCQSQGKILYRYTLGVYRFMEKLLARYPNLLLEGCSGGGGRFDLGMLYYCPQIWCSDNTDAIDRIRIQYGTSFAYPLSAMGAHVSAVPNYDTRRVTPLSTRAVVAMAGTFGYELDLNLLSQEEKEQVRRQIQRFIRFEPLIHQGLYYRLTPVGENSQEAGWMCVARDGSEALVSIVTLDVTGNAPNRFLTLAGLDPAAQYRDADSGLIFPAAALMSQGLPLFSLSRLPRGEYQSAQIHLVRVYP